MISSYTKTRSRTEALCVPLEMEDYGIQVAVFASPAKWHLAHTTWFFEQFVLKKFDDNYRTYDESYSFFFNSYYQQVGKRLSRGNRFHITRPTVKQVYDYRRYVDEAMQKLLQRDSELPTLDTTIMLGLQHEQQHQELLLTDLKYALWHNPLFPVYDKKGCLLHQKNMHERSTITLSEGVYKIGHTGENGFSFDHERGRHNVYIHEVTIDNFLLTNKDVIDFINEKGYTSAGLWLDDGWWWVVKNKITAPLYWKGIDGQWHHYTLAGMQPVVLDDIAAHLNFYEADALARWKGKRLPTESEWEAVSDQLNWGHRWEWTNSAYLPYPFFKASKGAIGEYNGKFMVNNMVLRGASVATAPGHSRKTYRNFFSPQHCWQYTGVRLAE